VSAGQYAALILAAGFSSRMRKGFKPLLPLPFADGERNALESLARLYAEAGIQRICVVGGQRQAADIAAEARRLGLAHVQNPDAERGMFSSVCAGLEALGASGADCFIHPVDIPLVRLAALRALLAEAGKHSGAVLVPLFQGEEGHPPLLPAAHIAAVLAWKGEGGLRGALRALPCRHVPVADRNILLDMDTDDDYAEVCGRAGRRHILEPEEAEELLRCLAVETRGMAHARAVGLVAEKFALACNAAAAALDPLLAKTGGLLHDMRKGHKRHEEAAGEALRGLGLPAVARIVEDHRDLALADDAPLTERELVYLADKYVYGDRLVSLPERFGRKLELFSEDVAACEAIRGRLARAEAMEQRLCRETGALPFELARDALQGSAAVCRDLASGFIFCSGHERKGLQNEGVWLMRHGALPPNPERRFVGQRDIALSEPGRRQMAAWRQRLADIPFAAVISSDLSRCVESARLVRGERDIPLVLEPAFRELSLGAWEGHTPEEIEERFPGAYAERGRDMARFRPEGGESFTDLAERVVPVFDCGQRPEKGLS